MTNPNDCKEYDGPINNLGYGVASRNGKGIGAHRKAWIEANGEIPNGLWVLHKCDNKRCVNVRHLYLGTHSDNTRDAVTRGRMATGNRHGTKTHPERILHGSRKPNAHYTKEQILEMRRLYQPRKWTLTELAKQFGGSISSVSRAIRGESYALIAELNKVKP